MDCCLNNSLSSLLAADSISQRSADAEGVYVTVEESSVLSVRTRYLRVLTSCVSVNFWPDIADTQRRPSPIKSWAILYTGSFEGPVDS
jgi:hypothetical protein